MKCQCINTERDMHMQAHADRLTNVEGAAEVCSAIRDICAAECIPEGTHNNLPSLSMTAFYLVNSSPAEDTNHLTLRVVKTKSGMPCSIMCLVCFREGMSPPTNEIT